MTKGKRREKEADDIYSSAGYDTFRPQEVKFGETDIFGLFDLFALGDAPDPVHLVQVKANQPSSISGWCEDALLFARDGVRVRMLVCYDSAGWRVIDPVPGGYEDVYDERDDERVAPHRGTDMGLGDGVAEWLREADG